MSSHLIQILSRELQRGHRKVRLSGSDSLVALAWSIGQAEDEEFLSSPRIIITSSDDDAARMMRALAFVNPDLTCTSLLHSDGSPFLGADPSPRSLSQRMRFLWRLQHPARGEVFICSIFELAAFTLPFSLLHKSALRLKVGDTLPEGFADRLQDWGYERESLVEDVGRFSSRGGIVDVYSPSESYPIRIELFGDQIESLRSFDPSTQKSISEVNTATIIPAREVFYSTIDQATIVAQLDKDAALPAKGSPERENLVRSLNTRARFLGMDYLGFYFHGASESPLAHLGDSPQIYLINPDGCSTALDLRIQELKEQREKAAAESLRPPVSRLICSWDQLFWPESSLTVEVSPVEDALAAEESIPVIDYKSFGLREVRQSLIPLAPWSAPWNEAVRKFIDRWRQEGYSIFISVENQTISKKLASALELGGLQVAQAEEKNHFWSEMVGAQTTNPRLVHLVDRTTPESIRLPDEKLLILHHDLMLGRQVRKKSAPESFQSQARTLSFSDLQPGDCIVHTLHGVGVYEGLKLLAIDGIENEYLQISYRDKDKLYLPVYRFNQIQKYAGHAATTVLDKLGGPQWEKTKAKARAGARDLAAELLALYAKRAETQRPPLPINHDELMKFEASFPYEETDDQLRAIEDIESDFGKSRPMDRLICGDVGFGKTEVAMRAAFMAASAGKQVAVLAPTTVLVFQHLETFKKRFAGSNLEIRALNRFISSAETRETLKLTEEGKVQILIGTHRLLSKDIQFKDLGLLIIDEEQRFGVAHKEKIRKLRAAVDTLAMSATPIPRSLNLSLMGIRDLSLINTAPVDRLPVRTFILKWNESTIRTAIQAEIKRGGQVYFIHNRVQSIYSLTDEIRQIVPEARIRVGHGQMSDEELEKNMLAFFHKEVDVLVCTTIVESGMDVSSANTIFIDQAHQLGLSQLYQLRGRVGRSKQRAFCYLLTPKGQTLDKIAQERLKVIHDNTALGSGIRIAQYDLELRGAGEILGENQSGHINQVGYEMYMDLLNEEIARLKGEPLREQETIEPEINLRVPASIPESYIPDIRIRLSFYKALSEIKNEQELEQIEVALKDQFGPLPESTLNLFGVMLIRQKCRILGVKDVSVGLKNVSLIFSPVSPLKTETVIRLATKENKKYSITPDSRLNIRLNNLAWPNILQELELLEKQV